MATLNPNALTSLERAKEELDIPTSVTKYDDQVINYINAMSDIISEETNRIFHEATYTHRFSGRGINWLAAKQFPVTTVNNVWVSQTYDFSTPLPATQYFIQDGVFFVRLGESLFWPGGAPLSIQIESVAGYATIPDGLQQACIEWIRLIYLSQGDRRLGRTSKSKQGENLSFENGIPAVIKALIKPYERAEVIRRALSLNEVFLDGVRDSDGQEF